MPERPSLPQVVLIAATLLGSWLGMQAVHESGHVLAARLTGGRVARVVLHPLTISRTDLEANPRPLAVAWGGPLFGVVAPLGMWAVAAACGWSGAYLLRFFAGFCLIANGAYLGIGSFPGAGDAGDLVRHGAPMALLWLFGVVTVPLGLWLWHGEGRHFGLGPAARPVEPRIAWTAALICLGLLAVGLLV